MAWTIEYTEIAINQLKRLDKQATRRIADYMDLRVAQSGDPRTAGHALTGPLADLWRYRVGNYRVLCELQDAVLRVLILRIARRDEAYR